MAAIHLKLPPLIEQLRAASGESAQLAALTALRQALEPSSAETTPCPDDFMATWLPGVLVQCQACPSEEVRRCLATFAGQVAVFHTGAQSISHSLACLAALLRDASPGVVKEAVLGFACVLRGALALVSLKPAQPDVRDAWDAVRRLQADACYLSQNHQHNCVRVAAAKLAEHIVLLFTSDAAPSIPGVLETLANRLRMPDAARLASEADTQLRWLMEPLRPAMALEQQPSRLIAHISASAGIAIARPNLMGKVLPCLLALAKEGGFLASNAPGAAGRIGGDVSVGNALRGALAAVLKSRVPSSVPWRERLVAGLQSLGAADTAANMVKYIERQEWKERRALKEKRPADEQLAGQDAKRPFVSGAVPATAPPPGATTTTLSPAAVPAAGGFIIAPTVPAAGMPAPAAANAPPYAVLQQPNVTNGSAGAPYGTAAVQPLPVHPQQHQLIGSFPGQPYGMAVLQVPPQGAGGVPTIITLPLQPQPQALQPPQPQPAAVAHLAPPGPPAGTGASLMVMDAHQQQLQQQAAAIITAAAQVAAGLPPLTAPPTDVADLDQILQYVDAAVRSQDDALLESLLTSLVRGHPFLLADLVLVHMPLLPAALPPHLWPPPSAAPAQAPAAAGPPQTAAAAAPVPPPPPRHPGPGRTPTPPPAAMAAAAAAGAQPESQRQQQQQAPPPPAARRSRGPLPPLPGPARPPELKPTHLSLITGPSDQHQQPGSAAAAAPAVQLTSLRPAALTAAQAVGMRQGALKRLMGMAPCAAPGRQMRRGILARFGARVPPGDATAEQLLSYVLRHYHDGGADLALAWLYALFVSACPLPQRLMVVSEPRGGRAGGGSDGGSGAGGGEAAAVAAVAGGSGGGSFDREMKDIKPDGELKEEEEAMKEVKEQEGKLEARGKEMDAKDEEKMAELNPMVEPPGAAAHGQGGSDGSTGGGDGGGEGVSGGTAGQQEAGEPMEGVQANGTAVGALGSGSGDGGKGVDTEAAGRTTPRMEAEGAPHAVPETAGTTIGEAEAEMAEAAVTLSREGAEGVRPAVAREDKPSSSSSSPPDMTGASYETVLLALLERARQRAVLWHASQLRRYSRGLREAAAALQQQRAALQPLAPAARVGGGLEGAIAAARQLHANVSWAGAQATWLQGEAAAMDVSSSGGGGNGGADGGVDGGEGDGEDLAGVPDLADEVAAEVEGVQASVQESMILLREWQAAAGQVLPATPPPAQPPRPVVGLEIKELLKAVPSVPLSGVLSFLRDLLAGGGKWPTLALSCAWDAIESRPPVRGAMLELVLEAAEDPHEEIRSAAVRLLTSKLYPRPHLRPAIVTTAALRLSSLMPLPTPGVVVMLDDGALVEPPPPLQSLQPPVEPPVSDCTRRCALYTALVAKQPDLLPGLVAAYAGGGPNLRAALAGHAGALAGALGPGHPALLAQLRAPVPGSEDLLLVMLHALTEKDLPPGRLVDACKAWYGASGDPRVLVPVAFTLSRRDVIALLPVMLRSLQPPTLKKLFRSLVSKHGDVEPLFSASELLLVLHRDLDPLRDGVPLKSLMAAVDLALHSPDIFPQPTMLSSIRAMEGLVPLPRMFMRTVIQALKAAPRLRADIMQLLERLVAKQIWTDRDQWRGFLLCADHMRSDAYTPLLQLPEAVLEVTLLGPAASEGACTLAGRMGCPPGCQLPLGSGARLAAYVLQPAAQQPSIANVIVTHQTRNILQRLVAVFRAQEEAAAAAAAVAAALKSEPSSDAAPLIKTESGPLAIKKEEPHHHPQQVKLEGAAAAAPAAAAHGVSLGPGAQAGIRGWAAAGAVEGTSPAAGTVTGLGLHAVAAGAGAGSGAGDPPGVSPGSVESALGGAAPGPSPGGMLLGNGPLLTVRAGREAAAAAAAAEPPPGAAAAGAAAGGGGRGGLGVRVGTVGDQVTHGSEKAGGSEGPGGRDDGLLEEGAGEEGAGGGAAGGVGAEMEAMEGGAGGGTNEFELDFEDDL